VAFVVIGVEKTGRRPAIELGRELPGEVDRVEHGSVDRDAP
jgi:hypothetical protein